MSGESWERYRRFNFEVNEDWLRYRANLVFPTGGDEASLTEKYRQKWYQRNVDANFELSNLAQSGSSFGTSSTSSSASEAKSGAGVFESTPTTPTPTETRTPPTAPKIESLDGDDDEPAPAAAASSSRPQSASQGPQQSAYNNAQATAASGPITMLQSAVVAGNLSVLFFSIFAVLTGSSSAFRFALLSSMFNNAISLYQIFGAPKFSMEYFSLISKNDNWVYIFYCFIFLTGHPMPLSLVPLIVFAFYNSSAMLKTLVTKYPIPLGGTISGYIDRANQPETIQKAQMLVANNEVISMPILFVYLFLGYSNIIQVILYWRFITQRFRESQLTRLIVRALEQRIDQFTASYGAVDNIWQRLKGAIVWLTRFGAPAAQPHQHAH